MNRQTFVAILAVSVVALALGLLFVALDSPPALRNRPSPHRC